MAVKIVQLDEPITLLGAGPVADDVLRESFGFAPHIVAVDGGAKKALTFGVMPQAVIGDFDSLDLKTKAQIPDTCLIPANDQNLTDFDKALKVINAPLILAVGFTGGRLDHELAVYSALVQHKGASVIVLGEVDVAFHLSRPLTFTLPLKTRVSLFPMAELKCVTTGLRYPTDHLTFSPWGRVGTSNATAQETITLTPSTTGMLVIMPRTVLIQVMSALSG